MSRDHRSHVQRSVMQMWKQYFHCAVIGYSMNMVYFVSRTPKPLISQLGIQRILRHLAPILCSWLSSKCRQWKKRAAHQVMSLTT
ncbi:hypothetical protein M5689_007311 [Euphorbia peplus]|nr:hypothetical protein M5689_007311 [Euphorbia peplus]